MRLIFIYGPPAAGKFTIGRILAERTGIPLFHNHLIVDAVGAVFPFGSVEFIRLREQFWTDTIAAAARAGRSLIFTFAPEASVARDFPHRLSDMASGMGGEVIHVALTVEDAEQERRIDSAARAEFGKLRSLELLRKLRPSMRRCEALMPEPRLVIDTTSTTPSDAADAIVRLLES
jgi:hypothetical protein